LLVCAILFGGCGSDSPTRSGPARLHLELKASRQDDPRTYSVGRVQLRALDAEETLIAAQIFPIDRSTGRFDLDFAVPAGDRLTRAMEPSGSGTLPDRKRTVYGVALQAVVRPLTVVAGEVREVTAHLEPFIPDSLAFSLVDGHVELRWKAMPIASSHR